MKLNTQLSTIYTSGIKTTSKLWEQKRLNASVMNEHGLIKKIKTVYVKAEIMFVTEHAVLVTGTKDLQDEWQELNRTTNKYYHIMTSSNGNIFHVTGSLWGESTGPRWIPLTKTSDAELWCFLWSAPEQMAEQRIEASVIWDAITLIVTSL